MFDAALVQREFPPPHSAVTLVDALRLARVDARVVQRDRRRIIQGELPRLVFLQRVEASAAAGDSFGPANGLNPHASPRVPFGLALLVKAEAERLLMFPAGTNEPKVVSAIEFDVLYAGFALESPMRRRRRPMTRPPPGPRNSALVGSTRSWPGIAGVWRDVLLASLFIQLIALATPLCSQVIIDKVIVHQTTSTLLVIASALAIFVLFGGALSWIRQYLVSHTGNRVDAVLGAAVFRHLMRLPLRYFEHRPRGARGALNGVETIREFLSGARSRCCWICRSFSVPRTDVCYSVWLSLVTLGNCSVVGLSVAVAPLLRARLNEQFHAWRAQPGVRHRVCGGLETVKSLQMEPQLERRYRVDSSVRISRPISRRASSERLQRRRHPVSNRS